MIENPSAKKETGVRSLGWEDSLEKEMATHSSILAWEVPRTEEPYRATICGAAKGIGHDLSTKKKKSKQCVHLYVGGRVKMVVVPYRKYMTSTN